MKHTWNTEYYDIINFYCQEPQHLGKKKNPKSSCAKTKDAIERVSRIEVSLNHLFNIFFTLLPTDTVNSLISDLVSRHVPDEGLDYQSQAAIDELKLGDMTQPDLFFVGNRSLVGIEIKLDAKADVEQILKYATLFYFSKQNHKKICDCHLILIGKRTFPKFFKEKFGSIKELKSQFLIDRIPDVSWKGKINLKPHKERILNLAKAMSIEYHTYSDLNEILMAYEERIDKQNAYSQTLVKLFAGIKNELVTRKLAK